MIATDHDGRFDSTVADHVVQQQARLGALAQAKPANPRGQSLEGHALFGHREPAVQGFICGKRLQQRRIRGKNVFLVTRQRYPAERPATQTKLRPNEGRHETGKGKRVVKSCVISALPQVVTIIKRDRSTVLQCDHCFHVTCHRRHRLIAVVVRVAFAIGGCRRQREADGDVAVEHIMRAGLIGQRGGRFVALRSVARAARPRCTARPR